MFSVFEHQLRPYKSAYDNIACDSCLPIDIHMTTVQEGSVSRDSCLCKASFFHHMPWGLNDDDGCVQCDLDRMECTEPGASTSMLQLHLRHDRRGPVARQLRVEHLQLLEPLHALCKHDLLAVLE